MIQPGNLDRQVVIQAPSQEQDGAGEMIATWSTFATVWAARSDRVFGSATAESVAAGALNATPQVTYLIRWRSGVLRTMRILDQGETWQIVHLEEVDRRAGLKITCQRAGL